jgi:hypothetical protein
MNEAELKSAIEQAIRNLFEHQPNLFEFTPETGQTEWNLVHHLASELHAFFPLLDCDLDVVKKNYGSKRPDIIFHQQGTHKSNYLVVEVKRNGSPRQIRDDAKKIKKLWFKKPLRYQFGAVVNLRKNGKHEIQLFKNST